ISNSRTRVGDWAFTTLSPVIGTVVLDNGKGRPVVGPRRRRGTPRTSFTVADIPGLVEDAYLDKGLGVGFLRHVERARILAFVVDLSAGRAVRTLQSLWKEVGEYERLRNNELNEETAPRMVDWAGFGGSGSLRVPRPTHDIHPKPSRTLKVCARPPVSSK